MGIAERKEREKHQRRLEIIEAAEHGPGSFESIPSRVGTLLRRTEKSHDAVTNELVDGAVVALDGCCPCSEVTVEKSDDLFRRQTFRQGRKTANIRE